MFDNPTFSQLKTHAKSGWGVRIGLGLSECITYNNILNILKPYLKNRHVSETKKRGTHQPFVPKANWSEFFAKSAKENPVAEPKVKAEVVSVVGEKTSE